MYFGVIFFYFLINRWGILDFIALSKILIAPQLSNIGHPVLNQYGIE